ncbi:hypothetical protein CK203_109814 [Vitis vinifera]|uniref:Uncharacterized protein n=1 Tax=Vitis vinifera TaxID=29760 RepID=A0A438CFK7_VITVI|nr:hypothetical protein CK203_109814 [Vitis vinifera]
MPHWGTFPILIEIYRSPLVYMIIRGYEIHARSMFDFILSRYSEEPLLSHSASFIPFDIVVILGWSCLWCLDFPRHHFRGPWRRSFSHISVTVSITRSRYIVFASLTIIPELSVERRSRLVESLSAISSGLRFAVACHTGASRAITVVLFRLPEPSLSSCLGFQSHYCHLVLASRAITVILFRLPEPSLSSCLSFQSHHCRLV